MIAGYVTYDELKLITGFSDKLLKKIIQEGRLKHKIQIFSTAKDAGISHHYNIHLYNLKEVEDWIKVYIY